MSGTALAAGSSQRGSSGNHTFWGDGGQGNRRLAPSRSHQMQRPTSDAAQVVAEGVQAERDRHRLQELGFGL